MITKLVAGGSKSFKSLLSIIDIKLSILTRQEKERLVINLYNQGKTFREIAKEARMSFRDIGVILNKIVKEKTEGSKEEQQQDNDKAEQYQEQEQRQLSLSAQAYKLFSERKTPLEVAIELNLRELEATKFYKEYWNLKQLHNLNMVYEEIGDEGIGDFLKLYKLAKGKGMNVQDVVNLLKITNNDMQEIEWKLKRLQKDVNILEFKKQQSHVALSYFKSQIEKYSKALNSFHIYCKREVRAIENLYNEKQRLESLVNYFKSDNEEYLRVKQAAHKEVKSVLNDSKILLNFATASVIESLRRNPELCNFVSYSNSNNNDTTSYGSNYLSLMLSGQQEQQPFSYISDDIYTAVILEESEKLYNKFITKLTNSVITTAAAMKNKNGYHPHHQ